MKELIKNGRDSHQPHYSHIPEEKIHIPCTNFYPLLQDIFLRERTQGMIPPFDIDHYHFTIELPEQLGINTRGVLVRWYNRDTDSNNLREHAVSLINYSKTECLLAIGGEDPFNVPIETAICIELDDKNQWQHTVREILSRDDVHSRSEIGYQPKK
jgi:hypothetical protein